MDEKTGRTRQLSESSDSRDVKRTKNADDGGAPAIAASPPKFVNFDKLMESLEKDTKYMALAHEIAVDNDFKLEKKEPPSNSLYALVKQNMFKVYWDCIQEDISKDPPVLTSILALCTSIRDMLFDLLLPHQRKMRERINNLFDIDHIKYRCEMSKNIEPLKEYGPPLLDLMLQLCCPMRDEEITRLRTVSDTVELFQGITRVLEEMKLDFANFIIRKIRPIVKENIVTYEKEKMDQIEEAQKVLGVNDPLSRTKDWLKRASEDLFSVNQQKPSITATLLQGYMQSVFQDQYINEEWDLPETLAVDRDRICALQQAYLMINVTAAVLLISQGYHHRSGSSQSIESFKAQVRDICVVVLKDVQCNSDSELRDALNDVASKVFQDIQRTSNGGLGTEDEVLFRNQLLDVSVMTHPVRNVLFQRIVAFVSEMAKGSENVKVPPGLSSLEKELTKLAADFLQIISLNRATYAEKYNSIITDINDTKSS